MTANARLPQVEEHSDANSFVQRLFHRYQSAIDGKLAHATPNLATVFEDDQSENRAAELDAQAPLPLLDGGGGGHPRSILHQATVSAADYQSQGAGEGQLFAPFAMARQQIVCENARPLGGVKLMKRLAMLSLLFCLAVAGSAQKAKKEAASAGAVDKAYLQKIWDGWGTLDAAGQKQYYAQGPHVFFDIAPVKYASWDEYQAGVTTVLADYKAAKFVLNDDLQIHKAGDAYWVTSTVASDMTRKSGKREMATMRWTAVFEKQDGKWVIVHEHVSEPLQ